MRAVLVILAEKLVVFSITTHHSRYVNKVIFIVEVTLTYTIGFLLKYKVGDAIFVLGLCTDIRVGLG